MTWIRVRKTWAEFWQHCDMYIENPIFEIFESKGMRWTDGVLVVSWNCAVLELEWNILEKKNRWRWEIFIWRWIQWQSQNRKYYLNNESAFLLSRAINLLCYHMIGFAITSLFSALLHCLGIRKFLLWRTYFHNSVWFWTEGKIQGRDSKYQ